MSMGGGAHTNLERIAVRSSALGADVSVVLLRPSGPIRPGGPVRPGSPVIDVGRPAGDDGTGPDLPATGTTWVWLLHGRGSSADAMAPLLRSIATAMDGGALPPLHVAVPDGPWSARAGWWVDSAYGGAPDSGTAPGRPVETALLREVLPELERHVGFTDAPTERVTNAPTERIVVGASMGGAAALRWAVVHPQLFGGAVLLSPAAYAFAPPPGSSARTSGAFGLEASVYCEERYRDLMHYPTLFERRTGAPASVTRFAVAVGDREPPQSAAGRTYDLDLEAVRLHAFLKRRPDVRSSLRVVSGGHDVALWADAVVPSLREVLAPR